MRLQRKHSNSVPKECIQKRVPFPSTMIYTYVRSFSSFNLPRKIRRPPRQFRANERFWSTISLFFAFTVFGVFFAISLSLLAFFLSFRRKEGARSTDVLRSIHRRSLEAGKLWKEPLFSPNEIPVPNH